MLQTVDVRMWLVGCLCIDMCLNHSSTINKYNNYINISSSLELDRSSKLISSRYTWSGSKLVWSGAVRSDAFSVYMQ